MKWLYPDSREINLSTLIGVGRFGLGRLGVIIGWLTWGTNITLSCSMVPRTLITGMLKRTAWTSEAPVIFKTEPGRNSWQICPHPGLNSMFSCGFLVSGDWARSHKSPCKTPKERQRPVVAAENESFDPNNSNCDPWPPSPGWSRHISLGQGPQLGT